MLTPSFGECGQCFPLKGSNGYVQVRLRPSIKPEAVTLEHVSQLQWDSGKTHYYQCHVASDGSYTFKGPLLEHTATHLHKVLGDENVLTVKFADVQKNSSIYSSDYYSTYKGIAKNGIMIGLRRYQFFVFKDGGKEKKKNDFSTSGVKCYFIRTDSTTANDINNPIIFSGKSIYEARMHFMHMHKLPSLANYMARSERLAGLGMLLHYYYHESDYKKKFNMEHAWRALRHDQKWCALKSTKETENNKGRMGESKASHIEGESESRPQGVKAAKRKGKRSSEKSEIKPWNGLRICGK